MLLGTVDVILIWQIVRCVNQIEDVCKDIEKTINQTIQNTLNTLEKDCEKIAELVDQQIEDDNRAKAYNLRASGKGSINCIHDLFRQSFTDKTYFQCFVPGILFTLMGLAIPIMLVINFTVSNASRELLVSLLGESGADLLRLYLVRKCFFDYAENWTAR